MPASNLLRMQPRYAWRAPDPAAAHLVLDLQSAVAVNLVALLFTNASASATWRIRAATSEANLTAAPGYDSGAVTIWPVGVPGLGLSTWRWVDAIAFLAGASGPGAQTYRFWRIDIADPSNAAGYFDAGQLIVDAAFQPTRNIAYGWTVRATDQAQRIRAAGGQLYPIASGKGRVLRFDLRWGTEAEMMGGVLDIDRLQGSSRPILAIRNPDRPDLYPAQAVYGLGTVADITNSRLAIYGRAFEIELLTP